jgi:prepilin-type N-terminal cleavage/methylation domain-containing protein
MNMPSHTQSCRSGLARTVQHGRALPGPSAISPRLCVSARGLFSPRPAFTLVELLTVVALIAIVVGIASPKITAVRR